MTIHAVEKYFLKEKQKELDRKLMGLMKCLRAPQRQSVCPCTIEQLPWAYNPSSCYGRKPVSLGSQSFMVWLSVKSSKLPFHDGSGKHYDIFQTSLVAFLIRNIQQDHFGLFISDNAKEELTGQSQTRQSNESSDSGKVKRHPTMNLSKVAIKNMRIVPWFLPLGMKPHHVNAAR